MTTSCEQGTCHTAYLCTPEAEAQMIKDCASAVLVFGDVECPMQSKWETEEELVAHELFEAGVVNADGSQTKDEFALDWYLNGGDSNA